MHCTRTITLANLQTELPLLIDFEKKSSLLGQLLKYRQHICSKDYLSSWCVFFITFFFLTKAHYLSNEGSFIGIIYTFDKKLCVFLQQGSYYLGNGHIFSFAAMSKYVILLKMFKFCRKTRKRCDK